MNGKTVYLDSSALAKRYLSEVGTGILDGLYHRAETRAIGLVFSLWNLGEVVSALARAQRQDRATDQEAAAAVWSLVLETRKMRDLGVLRVVPVRGDLVAEAVPVLLRRGLGQADALQIVTCRDVSADAFLTADQRLLRAARSEGLSAFDPTSDEDEIRSL